jgi:peptidoglycan biosynthesis protein MviN/MurJ (putative lipid II flippase)
MNKSELISKLIRGTFHRAMRESAVGVILIGLLAYQMQTITPGTPKYYGTILIIASLGFIMGVLWSYVIGYRTLRVHPESDTAFWMEAFQIQARLLRSVPLWYIAPVMTGVVITVLPTSKGSFMPFMIMLAFVGILFAGLTWLNRHAAQKLEEQAMSFT